ncbi:sn-glycerol-3-phosphate ABC transporter ATP-binding protein UgpC [Xanthobacter sp. VNH20]|uniref:ABC transporter ATP-binding protein n=1 Tax=Xanthobacter sp. VNH20 TaxID=3156616 RepID=UPI0032B4C361
MAEVILKDVCKTYGSLHVVKDVNLHIQDREFLVLVGPSGCGKSTTLRMVAGLEGISTGTIQIGSTVVNDLPPKDRDIAMVFQNYALYQHMTVYDNLAFGLRNRKVSEDKIKQEVMRATEILGLGPLLARKPQQLSGGQQQRVALGRCIVRHPQVFLFDEPLSNLDAKLRAQMRVELKRLRERVETTSIYVTHDQVEAMTLGDRVVVMKDGCIQQVGTPLDIYNRPKNRFVASFIGAPAMNFLPVDIVQKGDFFHAEAQDFSIRLPPQRAAMFARTNRRPVTLGVRPEQVCFGQCPAGHETAFSAPVEVTEQLGAEMVIGVRAGDTLMMASRIAPEAPIAVHDHVPLWLDPRGLHFFDRESEEAIN